MRDTIVPICMVLSENVFMPTEVELYEALLFSHVTALCYVALEYSGFPSIYRTSEVVYSKKMQAYSNNQAMTKNKVMINNNIS